jgi:hypothetical protein
VSQSDSVKFALRDAMLAFPHLRVGQLIWNATNGADLFYLGDKELAEMLRAFVKEVHNGQRERSNGKTAQRCRD